MPPLLQEIRWYQFVVGSKDEVGPYLFVDFVHMTCSMKDVENAADAFS